MKIKLNDDYFMAAGIITSKGVEFKNVGTDNTANAKFSIAIGNKEYVNCVAWRNLAEYIKNGKDGDNVFVVGKMVSREYNEKIYEDLYCDAVILISKNNDIKSTIEIEEPDFINLSDEEIAQLPF